MKTNITFVDLSCKHQVTVPPLYQYDYGQYLRIVGVNLPVSYEVLFSSNNKPAKRVLGDKNGVMVPDEYLALCYPIKAYIFLHTGEADGETVYVITIPVTARPAAMGEPVEPVEQDIIEQTIAALTNAITVTNENVTHTAASAEAAAESASASAASAQEAADIAASIQDVKEEAEQAIQAASDAKDYRDAAQGYASDASDSAFAAAGYAGNAADAAADAGLKALKSEGFAVGQQAGEDVASGSPYYHNNAKYYKEQAEDSATAASGSASDASGSASDALGYKNDAADYATAAGGSASDALGYKNAASDYSQNSEAWAVGQKNGVDVPSSDPTYHNNAKYYAEQAAGSASAAVEDVKRIALGAFATDTATGSIASFPDGADNIPVKSLTVSIVPIQSGSGDPSPDNIRPITGWTEVNVYRTGKNLCSVPILKSDALGRIETVSLCRCYANVPYVISFDIINALKSSKSLIIQRKVNGVTSEIHSFIGLIDAGTHITYEYIPDTDCEIHFSASSLAFAANRDSISNIQFEIGSVASSYEPYRLTSYVIPFGTTIYCASLDVINGVLKVKPYYASYNGETLTGEWICDRAVYAAGTTPPTGSQVVDMGGATTAYDLTPAEVTTLLGANNIWADTGDTNCTYRADVGLYIAKKIAEAEPAAAEA